MSRGLYQLARWAAILILATLFAFPLYWTITMAFKPGPEWNPPTGRTIWWPEQPTLSNFETVLGLKGAESTARHFPFLILALRLFPPILFLIPLFFVWVYLDLNDTLPGLVMLYGAFGFPFVVWLMRSFFLEVPRELSEAAIVDGCTHWGAFIKAVLPQVKGALAATVLFVFIVNWSDLVIALVMTQDRAQTAPVFLTFLQSDEFEREFGPQAALGLILMLPPLVLGLAIRRYLVRGLTLGSVRR